MGVDPAVLAEAVQRIGVLLSVTDPRLHPDVKVIIDGLTQAQADLAAARRERDMAVHVVQAEGKADYLLPVYEMNAFRVTVSRAEAERDAAVQARDAALLERDVLTREVERLDRGRHFYKDARDAARLALAAAEERERRAFQQAADWVRASASAHEKDGKPLPEKREAWAATLCSAALIEAHIPALAAVPPAAKGGSDAVR